MELEKVAQSVQVIAVIAGVVISVFSFNQARITEAKTNKIEALAPFYELRQDRYVEVSRVAAILSDAELYNEEQISEAKKRFRALYISELSMVESGNVEKAMKNFAQTISPELLRFTQSQSAAYTLSHALRDSFSNEL